MPPVIVLETYINYLYSLTDILDRNYRTTESRQFSLNTRPFTLGLFSVLTNSCYRSYGYC